MMPIRGSDIAGFFMLTSTGELGVHDAEGRFHVDAALTAAFLQDNRNFVRAYLKTPDEAFRLAIVYGAAERKPGDPLVMLFEEPVVRQLYPVGGPVNQGLTTFQKKNRQKPAPQGFELLIGYHRDPGSTLATFCPVLFDRHATLDEYAGCIGRPLTEAEAKAPVLEIVNLLAVLPATRHTTPETVALRERVAQVVAREIREPLAPTAPAKAPADWQADAPDAVAFVEIDKDKRRPRGIDFSPQRLAQLHKTQRLEQVERWIEIPYRPVDIGSLRRFVQFRDLDDPDLATLASGIFVYTAPSGARLLERGQVDAWNMYLLHGVVSLQSEDGASHFVEGETGKAAFPVAFLKPRMYSVAAVTPVSFLWVHDELLQSLAEHRVDRRTRLGVSR